MQIVQPGLGVVIIPSVSEGVITSIEIGAVAVVPLNSLVSSRSAEKRILFQWTPSCLFFERYEFFFVVMIILNFYGSVTSKVTRRTTDCDIAVLICAFWIFA